MCELQNLSRIERLKGGKDVNVGGNRFRVSCGGGGLGDARADCAQRQFISNFDTKNFDPERDKRVVYHCGRSGGQFTATLISDKK